jgi:hypothetical protein
VEVTIEALVHIADDLWERRKPLWVVCYGEFSRTFWALASGFDHAGWNGWLSAPDTVSLQKQMDQAEDTFIYKRRERTVASS